MSGSSLRLEIDGEIAEIALSRPDKRNALNEGIVRELGSFFTGPPAAALHGAVVGRVSNSRGSDASFATR